MQEEADNNLPKKSARQKRMELDNLGVILKALIRFIKNLVSMKNEIDEENTIKSIKESMTFKGAAVWILVCSIIVASVGLNANSVAVIIGAMLLSPLMGPIRAVGLALAINDIPTLKMGLKNFGVMVGVSILTSTIYFLITPINGDTSELLGRVKPHALDILIAFFGGLAGIIATASNNKNAVLTIVPGVAIATALMPPLCTVSYGIATAQWNYSLGAFYLFILNTVFICLSTIVLLRLLKFKTVQHISKEVTVRVQRYIYISLFVIIVPSIYMTYSIVVTSIFEKNAEDFVTNVIKTDNSILVNYEIEYTGDVNFIKIFPLGTEISFEKEEAWKAQMEKYSLTDTELKVFRYKKDIDQASLMAMSNESVIKYQEKKIKELEDELFEIYTKVDEDVTKDLNLSELDARILVHYPEISSYSFSKSYQSQFNNMIDTMYLFTIKWKDSIPDTLIKVKSLSLKKMLENEVKILNKGNLDYPVKVSKL